MSQIYEKIQNKYYFIRDADTIWHLYAAEEVQFTNDEYFIKKRLFQLNSLGLHQKFSNLAISGQGFYILFHFSDNLKATREGSACCAQ